MRTPSRTFRTSLPAMSTSDTRPVPVSAFVLVSRPALPAIEITAYTHSLYNSLPIDIPMYTEPERVSIGEFPDWYTETEAILAECGYVWEQDQPRIQKNSRKCRFINNHTGDDLAILLRHAPSVMPGDTVRESHPAIWPLPNLARYMDTWEVISVDYRLRTVDCQRARTQHGRVITRTLDLRFVTTSADNNTQRQPG